MWTIPWTFEGMAYSIDARMHSKIRLVWGGHGFLGAGPAEPARASTAVRPRAACGIGTVGTRVSRWTQLQSGRASGTLIS